MSPVPGFILLLFLEKTAELTDQADASVYQIHERQANRTPLDAAANETQNASLVQSTPAQLTEMNVTEPQKPKKTYAKADITNPADRRIRQDLDKADAAVNSVCINVIVNSCSGTLINGSCRCLNDLQLLQSIIRNISFSLIVV